MAKIQSKYVLRAVTGESYTLTGNDRNATITKAADEVLETFDLTKILNANKSDGFYFGNTLNIKRARVYLAGGQGMQPAADGTLAAYLALNITQLYDGSGPKLARFFLNIPKYEVWFDVNAIIKPYEGTPDPWTGIMPEKHICRLMLESTSKFSFDDFNVQADYVGQDIIPVIELEIETAGIIDLQGGRIY